MGNWRITIARRKAGQSLRGGTLEHLGELDSGRGFSPLRPYFVDNYEGDRIIVLLLDSQSSHEHFLRRPGQRSLHAILFLGWTPSVACLPILRTRTASAGTASAGAGVFCVRWSRASQLERGSSGGAT